MFSNWMKKGARRQTRSANRGQRALSRPSFQPRVEPLEDRLAPATITVTVAGDNAAQNTLRSAVNSIDAGANTGGSVATGAAYGTNDTILFNLPSGTTISLVPANGGLLLSKPMTITGPGAAALTVAETGAIPSAIFSVPTGVTVSISGLTITGGDDNAVGVGPFAGAIASNGTLTVSNCVFTANNAGSNGAGAIGSGGTLTVNSCTFTDNNAPFGSDVGAIDVADGTGTIQNSTFTDNDGQEGGAILIRQGESATVTNCSFTDNTALFTTAAGAIEDDGSVAISNSTFTGNLGSAAGGLFISTAADSATITGSVFTNNTVQSALTGGGAIANNGTLSIQDTALTGNTAGDGALQNGNGGTLTITGSQFRKNTSYFGESGGAITTTGNTTITNSTFAGNTSTSATGGGTGGDGGIFANGAFVSGGITLTLINDTLANNSGITGGAVEMFVSVTGNFTSDTFAFNVFGGTFGGGAVQLDLQNTLNLTNVLVSGNTDVGTGGVNNEAGVSTVTGTNTLIQDGGGSGLSNGVNGNIIGTTALLSGLGYFGGPILPDGQGLLTVALLPGSVALNAGAAVGTNGVPATDERGEGRVGAPDIGAFESQGFTMSIVSGNNQVGLRNENFAPLVVLVTANNPLEPVAGGQVTFTAPTSGASVIFSNGTNTISVTIAADGTASSGTVTANNTAGNIAVVASIPGGPSVTFNLFTQLPIYATGAGPGGGPEVKVFDAQTGALLADFDAFAPSFTGGVRVTVADINGDGFPDIIVGAGPGGGPQVAIFDGRTFQLITSFYALAPTFTGGIFVAVGDLDSSGVPDIVVGADAGGGPQVSVFSGTNFSLLGSFYAFAPGFTGGVRVAVGNINGTGNDIITGAGPGGAPQVAIFNGQTFALLKSYFALPVLFTGGIYVAAGDVSGTGLDDVIVGAGSGGLPQVVVFDGNTALLQSFYAYPPQIPKVDAPIETSGVTVGFAPLFGSATGVILTGRGNGAPPEVKAFQTTPFAVLDDFFAYSELFYGGVFVAGN